MPFNPQTALAYARALARPRLLGSGEDEAVAQKIVEQLTRFGWQVERQPFEFVTGVNQIIRLLIVTGEVLILLIFWAWGVSVWLSILLAALLLTLLFSVESVLRAAEGASLEQTNSLLSRVCWRVGKRYRTANIVARINPHPNPAGAPSASFDYVQDTDGGGSPGLPAPFALFKWGGAGGGVSHLYLMAHLDSKGQAIPVVLRAVLFGVLGGGALLFAILTLLRTFFPAFTSLGALAGIGAMLAGVPLLFLDANNRSPGAIDNASGLGLVLHLAECLAQDMAWREKLEVTLLITSAEELAVMGAAAFVRANLNTLQTEADNLLFLNFDGIGVRGRLNYAGRSGRLLNLIRQACAELGLPLARFGFGGVLFDHIPFVRRGFEALTLMSLGPAAWWVHTARDTVDKLEAEGFRQGGAVALRVVEKLASI